jgi:hypothetical protein
MLISFIFTSIKFNPPSIISNAGPIEYEFFYYFTPLIINPFISLIPFPSAWIKANSAPQSSAVIFYDIN